MSVADHLMANARGMAKLGWYVLPVRADKHPTSPHGLHDATNDPDALERLFSTYPGVGLAVDCGRSGLVVLDLDLTPVVDGRDSAREAGLPYLTDETPRALTPRGGCHVFYAGRTASRTGVLAGVDIKSTGGYVVVPPGIGRCWEADASPFDVEIAPAPQWLLRLAGTTDGTKAAILHDEWVRILGEPIGEGGRHRTLIRLAGHLFRRDVAPPVVRVLVESFNATKCRPPQDQQDVDRILSDVAELELRRRGDPE